MQIVIDTRQCPCRTLNDKCDIINKECYEDDICSSCPLIRNGGVKLPKGHGDLIDRDKLCDDYEINSYTWEDTIEYAYAVIKADKKNNKK